MPEDTPTLPTARTLSHWTHLLKVPNIIECPLMKIIGHDFEEPLFAGSGQIHIRSRTQIDFVMHAVPEDGDKAFRTLVASQKDPYDASQQFRLIATQYDGTEWNAGWTTIRLGESLGKTWRLSGPIQSLTTGESGPFIASKSGIEVVYDSKLRLPMSVNMSTSIKLGEEEVLRQSERGGETINVAGTQINFFVDPKLDATWAVAETSADFPHPHAENWVSEPLCLLLGQLVFPRLVARNFGDSAMIWLRPAPSIKMDTLAASILQEDPLVARDRFWEAYSQILTMIIRARDRARNRYFDPHPLTRYYHEIIQATQGSNWAWCLTLGSAIEGITKFLAPEAERKSDYTLEHVEDLKNHISTWKKNNELRERVLKSLGYIQSVSAGQILRDFKNEKTISTEQLSAWKALRNRVAHGELVPPWAEQELEERMHLLTQLMHRLSMGYIQKCSS